LEISTYGVNYLDVLDRIVEEEENVFKVANAIKQKKQLQKLLDGNH
jgi:hypothetical protein